MLVGTEDAFYTSGHCQTRRQRAAMLGSTEFKPLWTYTGARHSFDYCATTSSNCTAVDVQARAAADPYVMQLLGAL